jgi:hypothetical protein
MDFAGLSIERNNPKKNKKKGPQKKTKRCGVVLWSPRRPKKSFWPFCLELASHVASLPLSETDQMDGRSFVSLDTTLLLLPREDDTSFLVLANITGR